MNEELKKLSGFVPNNDGKSKKGSKDIIFLNQEPETTGLQNLQNVIRNIPGVSARARNTDSKVSAFSLFITDVMLSSVVDYTNKRIEYTIGLLPEGALEDGSTYK